MKTQLLLTAMLAAFGLQLAAQAPEVALEFVSRYETGVFDDGAAEITAYDANTQRLFVIDGSSSSLLVIDLSDPASPDSLFSISFVGQPNSVAVSSGLVALALENEISAQDPGKVLILDTDGAFIAEYPTGALPDMVTFTKDGNYILTANEGEPDDDYVVDPEGSVTIIDISAGADMGTVATADFNDLDSASLDASIRIFGPGASIAQDLEPEFITTSDNGLYAWVACQENNAIAVVNIPNAEVVGIFGMGFKDHSLMGNELDASNDDDTINITNWPALGIYQPDAIQWFRTPNGQQYIITANEGDARDYDGYSEEERVRDLALDTVLYPNADDLQANENLGRLKTTTANGDIDADGFYEEIYSYGARSFSIYTPSGTQVYDSGNEFETITASIIPGEFNSTNDENDSFDNRSDDKGPEPEGVVVGELDGRLYAFIGLERVGGIMVYDVTKVDEVQFVQYINTRDFSGDAEAGTAGDLAPEGISYISRSESPDGEAYLVVSYEVSGTVSIYRFAPKCAVPSGLTASFTGDDDVMFSWDAVENAFGYRLRLQEDGAPGQKLLASGTNGKMVSGFESGVTYNWTVRAACAEDTSGYAAQASFTYPTARLAEMVEMQLTPNPATDRVYVQADGFVQGHIYAMSGRLVKAVSADEVRNGIDISDLNAGRYMVSIQTETQVEILPFVKQ